MTLRLLPLALAAVLPSAVGAQDFVFKCTDARGRVMYSEIACATGSRTEVVDVRDNSVDLSGLRRQAEILQWQRQREELAGAKGGSIGPSPSERALSERKDLCDRLKQPVKGSRGMTASQRRAVVSVCTGVRLPDEDGYGGAPIGAPAPMPAPSPAPSSVTNCDAGGCWDNLGGRYTRGAGNTYFPTTGGPSCQMIGGVMRCP